jgi:hypothetical protein
MLLVEGAVDKQVEVEPVADTLAAAVAAASLAAVADRQSVRSAADPYIADLRISLPHDGLQHRLPHPLQLPSGVVFFF